MTDRLELRIPSLDLVPAAVRSFYAPDGAGGFRLNVGGTPPPAASGTPPAPPAPREPVAAPEEREPRTNAERAIGDLVRRAVDRIRPRPEAREAVAKHFLDRIQNRGSASAPELVFLAEPGWRLPSSEIGRTWAEYDEWLMKTAEGIDKQLLHVPPPPKTAAQAALEDSEPFKAPPKNIRVPRNCDQRTFEAAYAEAQRRGGELVYEDVPEQPRPSFVPNGRDVPITSAEAKDQAKFEAALNTAHARGGDLVIVDGEHPMAQRDYTPPAPPTIDD